MQEIWPLLDYHCNPWIFLLFPTQLPNSSMKGVGSPTMPSPAQLHVLPCFQVLTRLIPCTGLPAHPLVFPHRSPIRTSASLPQGLPSVFQLLSGLSLASLAPTGKAAPCLVLSAGPCWSLPSRGDLCPSGLRLSPRNNNRGK